MTSGRARRKDETIKNTDRFAYIKIYKNNNNKKKTLAQEKYFQLYKAKG